VIGSAAVFGCPVVPAVSFWLGAGVACRDDRDFAEFSAAGGWDRSAAAAFGVRPRINESSSAPKQSKLKRTTAMRTDGRTDRSALDAEAGDFFWTGFGILLDGKAIKHLNRCRG